MSHYQTAFILDLLCVRVLGISDWGVSQTVQLLLNVWHVQETRY